MRPVIAGFALLIGGLPASAETLVVALSTDEIQINSNFTGTGVTVFGAIERDAATVSRAGDYGIAVVMRGPAQSVVTRRKDRIVGLWVNSASAAFPEVPSFYAVHTSGPADEFSIPAMLDRYQIGLRHIDFGAAPPDPEAAREWAEFRTAFIRLKAREGLYRELEPAVQTPGANIFQTTMRVPANIPDGDYMVSVYLFRSSALLAVAERPLVVSKIGFEQLVFDWSRNRSLAYALAVVVGAVFIGWLAGVIFRRD